MVTTDVEHEIRLQLKEAGRLLSSPPATIDELLHILDQLGKILSMVDQSPNDLMQEALKQPMKALVDASLLEHSRMDVKVLVAFCLCEITRITAPDAPYSDEEMKCIFQCIVSSIEDLSDKSCQYYAKRVSIVETISKVRSCVIMLDLECDDLIVQLFEHFLNSVRDHHLGNLFLLMVNIMTLVLEESEEISVDMLKPLLASIKNNNEGILPVARKLGERVIKKSENKLRPYLNKALTTLGDSLVDYSRVLTSICEGATDFVEHNDESASVQPKVVNTTPTNVSSDHAAQVNGEMVIEDEGDAKKPEGAVDPSSINLTSKLDPNNSAAEKSINVELKCDTTTKSAKPLVSNTILGENRAFETVVSDHKPVENVSANAPSQSVSQQDEPQNKIQIKKGIRSKKKGPIQADPSSTVAVLTKVNEGMSDPDMRSPKRARKKTQKAEESNPLVPTGSDVETSKNLGKGTGDDSLPKAAKRSGKKAGGGGSVAKKLKLSGKKVSESKKSKQGDSEVKPAKRSLKKDNETDSDAKPLKQSGKKRQKSKVISKPSEDIANKDEETDSDMTPLKMPENKEKETDSVKTPHNLSENEDDEETDSDNIPLKFAARKGNKSSSSVVKSSLKSKNSKKQGRGKDIEEVDQTKSLSEDDDGMNVSIKSVLQKATKGKGNTEEALSTGLKRKRSITKSKATETMKYDDSLIGQKVKVWWPHDKMYYEGVVESFDSAMKKHTVLYLDGDQETLNLRKEKWEILKEFSEPSKEVAFEPQNSDILPEITGVSKGESNVTSKEEEVESKEDEETTKDDKIKKPKKIVYSRGKKGSKNKTKSPDDDVKASADVDASEEPESAKEKSTETPKSGSKGGKKKRR
ncbi:hypothetical protein R6Q57_012444 [Mikania cordata]